MKLLIIKYLVTAFLIVLISEIARRTEKVGAFLGALPLVAIGVLIWMYLEGQGADKIANYAQLTFWYVIPTLPMFLLFPWFIGRFGFWPALGIGCVMIVLALLVTSMIARVFQIELL